MTDPNELVERLKKGNESAFSELLDEFQQKVFHTCLSFVPNKEDAEDIAQEVFLEVYRSIDKFQGNSKLSTWIYKISTNKEKSQNIASESAITFQIYEGVSCLPPCIKMY